MTFYYTDSDCPSTWRGPAQLPALTEPAARTQSCQRDPVEGERSQRPVALDLADQPVEPSVEANAPPAPTATARAIPGAARGDAAARP